MKVEFSGLVGAAQAGEAALMLSAVAQARLQHELSGLTPLVVSSDGPLAKFSAGASGAAATAAPGICYGIEASGAAATAVPGICYGIEASGAAATAVPGICYGIEASGAAATAVPGICYGIEAS